MRGITIIELWIGIIPTMHQSFVTFCSYCIEYPIWTNALTIETHTISHPIRYYIPHAHRNPRTFKRNMRQP